MAVKKDIESVCWNLREWGHVEQVCGVRKVGIWATAPSEEGRGAHRRLRSTGPNKQEASQREYCLENKRKR